MAGEVVLIRSFKDLQVWQEAHRLVLMAYRATEKFPRSEQFGLATQFRRSAVSVPANIAEGFGRRTTKELLQSLAIANGSLEESRYYVFLASELRYIQSREYQELGKQSDSVARLISALSRSLKARMKHDRTPVTGHQPPDTRD